METSDVMDFATVARRYCDWIEAVPDSDDLLLVHQLLTELQLNALNLPDRLGDDEYLPVEDEFDNLDIRERLHELPIDGYWKVFDVFADSEEPVFCTLADDLGDIYADLKEGLNFYLNGNEAEAIWRWHFAYYTHWGRHLMGAQTAIHQYFADQGGPMQTLSGQQSSEVL